MATDIAEYSFVVFMRTKKKKLNLRTPHQIVPFSDVLVLIFEKYQNEEGKRNFFSNSIYLN